MTKHHTPLGRSMPANLPRTISAKDHNERFFALDTTDVWTADGWLVTSVVNGTTHQLRKGSDVEMREIQGDELFFFAPTAKSEHHGI